ncbi:hypothetical protein GYMLUDRAFT_794551 [Collybiopsis luxurians FD-317 M1]|nr:hypothetical protein GYMLUDRAFT_794551 [Collybiopsis luxurians FD-317 M1]
MTSHPSANQPRLLAPKVSQHDSVPVTSTPVQRQQSRTPSAVFTPQASPVIDSTQRISPNAVYPSTQSPSQPQHMAHRSQQNRVSSGSPVRQHFSQTGVASQPGTQAFIPTQAQLLVSHKNTQQHSHSHTQPGVRLPQHPSFSSSATTTQPIMRGSQQRSASLPHPLSQVQAPPQSHSESQRPRPAIFQNSSVPSLPSRFVSSPVPSSPVAQSPPNNHHWNPTLPQPPPASSPYPAIHNPAAAPESSQVSVTEVQALEKSSVPGRAPPTPPQSDKSLSPEQEHDLRLPATPLVIRPEPHKRGSTEMEPGDEGRQSSPKRIRLHGGIAQHQPGVNLDGWTNVRPLREPDDAQMTGSRGRSNQQGTDGDAQRSPRAMISLEPMTVDKEVIDLTAPVTPSLAGGEEQAAQVAKAQEKEEVIEPPVTVIEGRFNGAFVPVPEAAPTSIAIVSEASTSAAEDAAPATADQRNAVDQAEDSESDDDSDDSDDDSEDSDTQGRSERSSARFLLKSKAGRKVCRLCRTRVKKYPGQYEHTIFDRDTPLLVLVGHFSRVHTTAWCKLRGLPIPEGVSAQSPTAAAVSVS